MLNSLGACSASSGAQISCVVAGLVDSVKRLDLALILQINTEEFCCTSIGDIATVRGICISHYIPRHGALGVYRRTKWSKTTDVNWPAQLLRKGGRSNRN